MKLILLVAALVMTLTSLYAQHDTAVINEGVLNSDTIFSTQDQHSEHEFYTTKGDRGSEQSRMQMLKIGLIPTKQDSTANKLPHRSEAMTLVCGGHSYSSKYTAMEGLSTRTSLSPREARIFLDGR